MAITWRNVNLNNSGAGLAAVGARQYEAGANRLMDAVGRIDKRTMAEQQEREALGLAQFQEALTNQTELSPLDVASAIQRYGVDPTQAVKAYRTEDLLRRQEMESDRDYNLDARSTAATEMNAQTSRQNANTNMLATTDQVAANAARREQDKVDNERDDRAEDRAVDIYEAELAATKEKQQRERKKAIIDEVIADPRMQDNKYMRDRHAGEQVNKELVALTKPNAQGQSTLGELDPLLVATPTLTEKLDLVNKRISAAENAQLSDYHQEAAKYRTSNKEEGIAKGIMAAENKPENWDSGNTKEAQSNIRDVLTRLEKELKIKITGSDAYELAASAGGAYSDFGFEYFDEDEFEIYARNALLQKKNARDTVTEYQAIKDILQVRANELAIEDDQVTSEEAARRIQAAQASRQK